MDEILTKPNAIYWTTLAIVVIIEHLILGERWRSNELARRVVGVATVTLGMLPLIVWGGLDWTTWAVHRVHRVPGLDLAAGTRAPGAHRAQAATAR